MAKKSVANRNKCRKKLSETMRVRRDALRDATKDINLTAEERFEACQKLQKLPRDSSPVRVRNRCNLCERPRSNTRLTGLCRIHMRTALLNGFLPGMRKASW